MRKPRTPALLLALVVAALPATTAAEDAASQADEILRRQPRERLERLLSERVVLLPAEETPQDPPGQAQALVLFARPLPVVLARLTDGTRQREYRPELRTLRLVTRSEREHVYEYQLRMLLVSIDYRLRHHWDPERAEIWWELDPEFENDLAALEGHWQLHAYGPRRTLGSFRHRVEIGPALPGFLSEVGTRAKLPEAMHHVRRWIDSDGRYRP